MPRFTRQSIIDAPPYEVYDWHARPGAFERLTPPWQNLRTVHHQGGIKEGATRTMKLGLGPVALTWKAIHGPHIEGRQFVDEQIKGPFRRWVHTHRFEDVDHDRTRLIDDIEYELPLAPVSSWLAGATTEETLQKIFAFRHRRTMEDLRRHQDSSKTLIIAVTGSTGLIGQALCAFLSTGGHRVIRLVRQADEVGDDAIFWSPSEGILDPRHLQGLDVVIHLAGESVAARWTARKKQSIEKSRVRGTAVLAEAIAAAPQGPSLFLSASGVGYYGDRGDQLLSEGDSPGDTFLAGVCQRWEEATEVARHAGVRTVQMRLGVVLSPKGGALPRLQMASRLGLAGRLGSGDQYVPWIDLDDVLGAIHFLIQQSSIGGPVNICAPRPLTNRQLMTTLGETCGRPAITPIPRHLPALRLGSKAAAETVLVSQRAIPSRLVEQGFDFFYPDLSTSLAVHLGKATSSPKSLSYEETPQR